MKSAGTFVQAVCGMVCMAALLVVGATTSCTAQGSEYEVVEAYPALFLGQPTDIRASNDGTNRLFVCEKAGRIHVFENNPDVQASSVFLDISDVVITRSEMGLLGLDFDPDYVNNGYFFVHYNLRSNGVDVTRIARFSVRADNPNQADPESEVVVLEFQQPFPNHDGGSIMFGPDGYLYIAMGDGGSGNDPLNSGQDLRTLLGAILRIDISTLDETNEYAIPESNPYAGNLQYRQEIYAWGLRNPWRCSFDTETGQLWCGDVGQGLWEEVDIIEKGGNYGWRIMEGFHCFNPQNATDRDFDCDSTSLISPVWEYEHDNGDVSITGGYVYRGEELPELVGRYIFSDFNSGRIWGLEVGENETTNILIRDTPLNVSTFGTTENNELLIGAFNGKLYKIERTSGVGGGDAPGEAFFDELVPNPADDGATVSYRVTESGDVRLRVINGLGEELMRPVDEHRAVGDYNLRIDTGDLPTGTYLVRLETNGRQTVRKMTVVR